LGWYILVKYDLFISGTKNGLELNRVGERLF
jgi:hypothetical protein